MDRVDTFVANLYRSMEVTSIECFRNDALHKLNAVIDFDGAFWGCGSCRTGVFHSAVTLGVDPSYPRALEKTQAINPLVPVLQRNMGHAVNMATVLDDETFHNSEIYARCFARYGVERILAYTDFDPRNDVHTLLSLYRFDTRRAFTEDERRRLERAAYHLISACTHAFYLFLATRGHSRAAGVHAAICDVQGVLYQSQPALTELIEHAYPGWRPPDLPFAVPAPGQRVDARDLSIECEALGDLYCLYVWQRKAIDELKPRDRAIVTGVCSGMTFKDIARDLQLAPSTVSNRLYRVYRQLGVTNRSSLIHMINKKLSSENTEQAHEQQSRR